MTEKGQPSDWSRFAATLKDIPADGTGLFILSESSGSPSVTDMKARLLKARPKAQWFEYEAVSNDAIRQGTTLAFGKPYRVVPQLDKAAVILSIDADLFNADPSSVKYSRDFANGRRLFIAPEELDAGKARPVPPMNRLYAVDSIFSTTSSCADHRLPVKPSMVAGVLYAIAQELGLDAVKLPAKSFTLGDRGDKFVKAVAQDLKDNAGKCVLVAGIRQPPAVHALVALLNTAAAKHRQDGDVPC